MEDKTTGLLIREVQLKDTEALVNILNPIIDSGKYTVLDTLLTVEDEQKFIENFPKRGIFNVAERLSDNKVIGLQNIEPFATYTHAFDHVGVIGTFVDLNERRKGVGTSLAEHLFKTAKGKGYEKIFGYIRADNTASLSFHLKLGFYIIGTAHKHSKFKGEYIDEIMIERFL